MKTTNTKPPIDIYDVLHEAEKHGVELPKCIDDWWTLETAINESKKEIMGQETKDQK